MRRTHGANNVGSLPARSTSGTPGYFVDRDVVGGVAGTVIDQDWLNVLQEEIIAVVSSWGLTPDDTGVDLTQLDQAIRLAVAGIGSDAVSYAGSNTQTRVLLGSSNSFVGSNDRTLVAASDYANVEGEDSAILASAGPSVGSALGIGASAVGCFVAGSYDSNVADDLVTNGVILASASGAIAGDGTDDVGLLATSTCSIIGASTRCVVLASEAGQINSGAGESAMIASDSSTISAGVRLAVLGSLYCSMPDPTNCQVMLASKYCDAGLGAPPPNYSVLGGYHASTLSARTWGIESQTGTFRGTAAYATGGLDYAEYFQCFEGEAHPVGRLLAGTGKAVRLAQPGDRIRGIVSADPTVIGGDDGIAWSGRYLRDEFHCPVMEQVEVIEWRGYDGPTETAPPMPSNAVTYTRTVPIPDDEQVAVVDEDDCIRVATTMDVECVKWDTYSGTTSTAPCQAPEGTEPVTLTVRKTNPKWNPAQTQVPRSQRPDEWSVVGLIGQLRLAIDATVEDGDDIIAGKDGLGTKGDWTVRRGAQVEVMEIEVPYSKKKGYGVALVFVR